MLVQSAALLLNNLVGVDVVKKRFTGREKLFMLIMSVVGAVGLVLTVPMSSLWTSAVINIGALVGGIVDAAGYPWAFTALAVPLIVAGLVSYLLKEPAGTPV